MLPFVTALAAGFLFALGLGIAGMMDPDKVHGFLDITGQWDPSLALVMVSALAVTFVAYRRILQRREPLCSQEFSLPSPRPAEARLVLGSLLFGIGWGLSGLCPGPALANLATGHPQVIVFVLSMTAGWLIYQGLSQSNQSRRSKTCLRQQT